MLKGGKQKTCGFLGALAFSSQRSNETGTSFSLLGTIRLLWGEAARLSVAGSAA